MPYETVHVHVSGTDPAKIKGEIQSCAEAMHMSVSAFMMFCFEQTRPNLAKLVEKESRKSVHQLK